jgi:hypothetical protein
MKRYLLILFLSIVSHLCLYAQLSVGEECAVKDGDITAYRLNDQQPITIDGDTIPFALVRVGLVEPNATFDSKWVLKQEFKDNEYWVYFMEGVKSVTIKTKRFTPLHYKFPEPLKAKNTYVMSIQRPDSEKYKGNLHITSNVPHADIYVDGSKVSDGTPFTYTGDPGIHQVELRADGYDPQSRQIDIPMGQTLDVIINLFEAGALSVDGVGYGMVPVEAASFSMGSPLFYYTKPVHKVNLRPFSVGSMLVSVDLWEKVMGEADSRIKGNAGQVVDVSYDEIQDFISSLNAKTGKEFRLPTEAEWEYLSQHGHKLGVSDLGTSMEWCQDWFGKYSISDTTNPQGPEEGVMRSVRGGSEYSDDDPVYKMNVFRWRKQPDKSSPKISFRLVQDN